MHDEQLRQTGIGVVGDVPWGTHFFLFRFMEKEEMSSPRDIADNTDSGLPQLFIVHSGLPLELFGCNKI